MKILLCPNNCSGNGICDYKTGMCKCNPNWSGDDCSVKILLCPNNCSGNGICDNLTGMCKCKDRKSVV